MNPNDWLTIRELSLSLGWLEGSVLQQLAPNVRAQTIDGKIHLCRADVERIVGRRLNIPHKTAADTPTPLSTRSEPVQQQPPPAPTPAPGPRIDPGRLMQLPGFLPAVEIGRRLSWSEEKAKRYLHDTCFAGKLSRWKDEAGVLHFNVSNVQGVFAVKIPLTPEEQDLLRVPEEKPAPKPVPRTETDPMPGYLRQDRLERRLHWQRGMAWAQLAAVESVKKQRDSDGNLWFEIKSLETWLNRPIPTELATR